MSANHAAKGSRANLEDEMQADSADAAEALGPSINKKGRPNPDDASPHVPMACGSNDAGALGIAEDADQDKKYAYPAPTFCCLPSGTPDIVQVFAGGMHSGFLTADGRVFTFGQNHYGALGRQVMEDDPQLGENFIGSTVKKMETKNKDGKMIQEEVDE